MTYIPHELYTLYLYNHAGKRQLLIQGWTRLEFHQRINAAWNHQITLEMSPENPDTEVYRSIEKDWILTVDRTDPVTGIKTRVYEGFQTTVVDQLRINGNIIFNLYGVGYTQLLARRVVVPDSGLDTSTKTGKAETVFKNFVAESMVTPLDVNRVFPNVTIEPDLKQGLNVLYESRYTILLSVCENVAKGGGLDFGIVGGTNIGEFSVRVVPVWGEDRTLGNTAGNLPVVFSVVNDNMVIPILSTNTSAEQNYGYIGGAGQGADRTVVEVSDSTAIALSPWGRKEFFADGRQQTDDSALISIGQDELFKRKTQQTLSFNIKQTTQSRWIQDWNLGDLVSAEYFEILFNKQIVEIIGVVTAGQSAQQIENIQVELEDA